MNRLVLWWRILTGAELQASRVELFEALEERETATGNHAAAQKWAAKAAEHECRGVRRRQTQRG